MVVANDTTDSSGTSVEGGDRAAVGVAGAEPTCGGDDAMEDSPVVLMALGRFDILGVLASAMRALICGDDMRDTAADTEVVVLIAPGIFDVLGAFP